jgi:hypothetical protein
MVQQLISVVQGDKDYDLNFTLTDSAGVIVNLTNGTLKFNAQLLSDPTVQFKGSMSIVSAVLGTCKYTVQATDFDVPGTYNCQIEVDYTGVGEVITFSDIQVIVETRIPI